MTTWVKWTIAGTFAVMTLGSLYTAATADQSGKFGEMAEKSRSNLDNYDRSMCEAGNKAHCK